ncbi:hypothetical protein EVAR_38661_1 [Eumeta japonica]|uniref:Uncharacterized protein n=1 Tax=Eumeta variegata TaxID=151549 RepID=A0A4C1Y0D4_EUMVA|nr:hypothetical protein EVAR_38661_1 [Eumeta japonica]
MGSRTCPAIGITNSIRHAKSIPRPEATPRRLCRSYYRFRAAARPLLRLRRPSTFVYRSYCFVFSIRPAAGQLVDLRHYRNPNRLIGEEQSEVLRH